MSDETPKTTVRRMATLAGGVGTAIVWIAGLAIVIVSLASLGAIVFSRSQEGSKFAITEANRALAKSSNLRIEAERTELVAHGARIVNLRLVALDSLNVGHPLVIAREARLGTSWWGLLRGQPGEIAIELDHPVISLVRTKEGRWLVPRFMSTGPKRPPPEGPLAFALTMREGVVRFIRPGEAPDTVAHSLALRGTLDRAGRRWTAAIGRGSADLPGLGLALQRTTASAVFEEGSFNVPRLVLRTDAGWLELKGDGRLTPAFEAAGSLEAGEWQWRTLARLTGQEALDLDGGVAGKARFELGGEGLALDAGRFDVLWRDEPVRVQFDGRWREDHLALTNTDVAWRDARFLGRFDWFNRRGRWALGGDVSRLDLSELPRLWPMAALDTTDLGAQIELASQGGAFEGRVARGRGVYRGVAVDSLTGTWAMRNQVQTLDASARVAEGRAGVRGTIRREGLALEARASDLVAEALPARVWQQLGLSSPPAGFVRSFQARLDGPASSPQTRGTIDVEDLRVAGLELGRARAAFDGRLGRAFVLRLSAQAADGRVGPARADTAFAFARVTADSIVLERLHAARVDSVLEVSARAHRVGGVWHTRVEDLSWSSLGLGLSADGPFTLRIHGDGGIDVDDARIVSTAGTIAADGTWGGGKRASNLAVHVETLDLEALLGTIATESRVRGVVNGEAHLSGAPGSEVWRLDLTGRDVRYRQFTAPEVVARGRFTPQTWWADRLALDTGKGKVAFEGELQWSEAPPWSGSAEDWNRALRSAPRWQGTLTSDSLSLAQLSEWLPQLGGWRGFLDAKVELAGRPTEPIASAIGRVREPAWGTASLGDVRYEFAYANEDIAVKRLESGIGDSLQLFAQGHIPMRLGWGVAAEERLPDRPMALQLRSDRIDLGIITTFLTPIAAAAGRAELVATIGGTPRRPRAEGRLRVVDGILRPAGREETFDRVNAEFTLTGDELTVVSATARQGKNGLIEVKPGGKATLKDLAIDEYAVELTAHDVTGFASGEYVIRLDGTFKVEDGARTGGPLPLPHITGKATVIEGVFLYNFADTQRQAASQGPVAAPPWTYHVFVEAENNLWYRPPDANIEGKLHDFEVVQQLDRFFMLGGVEALRGRFYFLGNSFAVDQGMLFFDNAEQNNPTIDATLSTEKALRIDQSSSARERITLTVSGRAFEPNISLSSEPANLSESEIVQLLTFGQFTGGGAGLGNLGAQYLMGQLRQDFQGLTEAVGEIEFGETLAEQAEDGSSPGTGTTTKSYATVGLSRYFTRDLLVRYSQVVGDVTQATQVDYQDLVAEYRLNRLLYLRGQVTRRRGVLITSQDQTIYRFDVHARHEY